MSQDFFVSQEAAVEYERTLENLISSVDKRMTVLVEDSDLIGSNPLSVMYDNHENHARLMTTVFRFNDFTMLEKILPWVVHNYSAKGFSPEYFTQVLIKWSEAIGKRLSMQASKELLPVYEWMQTLVPQLYKQQEDGEHQVEDIQHVLKHTKSGEIGAFVKLLITGAHKQAQDFVTERVSDRASLVDVYDQLIRPSMYEVGRLWEENLISVAHEHLATSIVLRIITSFYGGLVYTEPTKGIAVVSASANEFHEIGARMVADMLEMDGWDVSYLGANTPIQDLLYMLEALKPDILCLSVTMVFNLPRVQELIQAVRRESTFDTVRIMVGGHAVALSGSALDSLGADAVESSALNSIRTADRWWDETRHE